VKSESAKIAPTETAAIVCNRKTDFFNSGDAAERFIPWMICPGVRELRHSIERSAIQRKRRGIYDKRTVSVRLEQKSAAIRIMFGVFYPCSFSIAALVLTYLLK